MRSRRLLSLTAAALALAGLTGCEPLLEEAHRVEGPRKAPAWRPTAKVTGTVSRDGAVDMRVIATSVYGSSDDGIAERFRLRNLTGRLAGRVVRIAENREPVVFRLSDAAEGSASEESEWLYDLHVVGSVPRGASRFLLEISGCSPTPAPLEGCARGRYTIVSRQGRLRTESEWRQVDSYVEQPGR